MNLQRVVTGVAPGTTEITLRISELGSDPSQEARPVGFASARVTVAEPEEEGEALTPGLYPLDGMTGLESLLLLTACGAAALGDTFGPYQGECVATVASDQGVELIDVATNTSLGRVAPEIGPLFGGVGLSSTVSADAVIFFFGQGGYGFNDGAGSTITPNRPVLDAYPAGADPTSGRATMVEPNTGFRFIGPTDEPPGFAVEGGFVQRSLVDGEPVSAWMRPDGSALLLTRDVTSRLYPYDGSAAGPPLELGLDARRVRCAEAGGGGELRTGGALLCGVSLFGDDEIAIVTWPGQGTPVLAGTAPAGDGPVGIDVRALPDGSFAVASTGFLDGTVTEHRVSAAGALLGTQARAVPTGCIQPGHVVYAGAPSALQLVGTCYGGGGYYVADSEL